MADAFLSFALENLANLATDEVELLRSVKEEVAKLSETHTAIQDSLHDAEMKQFKDKAVKKWMTDLKYKEYDMVDVLDEWMVKSHKLGTNNDGSCNSVWNFFTHCICFKQLVLRHNIGKRMKSINKKLDQMAKDKGRFNFQQNRIEFDVGKSRETSSRVDTVFGREDDKNKIKNKLISEGSSEPSDDIPVLSIVGMGGCGKTTLSQLMFNEAEVKSHFQERIWVCVSTEFDVAKIVEMILEAIKKERPPASGLEALSKLLWETLQNKRFLLVLDDVWNEDYTKWRDLVNILKGCGIKGSKIVVTTRNEKVALVMRSYVHKLDPLSDDLCWSIFRGIAFEGIDEPPTLIDIAKEIVAKCKGLPLAVKTIAGALRCAKTQMDWESALNAEIWDTPEVGVLPALLLSYYRLSPPLKRCFRYCSIFPKDSELKMEELVQMWVAQDYIPPDRKREIEDIGREYFEELLELSLFQEPERDEFGNITGCKMHDLVHDLAHFVTNGEFALVEVSNDNPIINIKNVRHCTWFRRQSNESHFIAFESLRTLVAANIDVCDIIQQLCCIRVLKFSATNNLESLKSLGRLVHLRYLDLSGSKIEALPESVMKLWNLRYLNLEGTSLKQIPESVGKLGQLRHINLQSTEIKELPESIADLRHLQVLGLSWCFVLCQLPSGIQKMTSLKQLRINNNELRTFPAGIGRLTSLERLDRFILTEGKCNLSELRHLNRIRGSLCIENLWLGSREEAVNAKLEDKTFLQGLELWWRGEQEPSRAEGVLEALRPPPSLQNLHIWNYKGFTFPGWVGEPTFSRLVQVKIWWCYNCIELPALANFPQLRSLLIGHMPNVRKVGGEFFGSSGKNGGWFPKLETLQLKYMDKWEEWNTTSSLPPTTTTAGGGVAQMMMPCLRSLIITDCMKLKALPPIFSQALKEVELHNCLNLRCGSESIPPSVEKMRIACVPADLFNNLPSLPNLKVLEIRGCLSLRSLPEEFMRSLEGLQELSISDCPLLEDVSWKMGVHMPCLRKLEIRNCLSLRSLPEELMRSLKGLQDLSISDCPLLEDVSWKMGVHMPCLRMLEIKHCGNLKVFPLIVSEALKEVVIAGCPNLTDVVSILSGVEKLKLSPAKMLSSLAGLPMLNYLEISGDHVVIEVPHDLIRFTELQTLSFKHCLNLRSLPEEIMSSLKRLQELKIYNCPNLRESCKMGGEQWSKIAHIPRIEIDFHIIQDHK